MVETAADATVPGRTGRAKRGNPALRLPARVVRIHAFLLSGHDPLRGPVQKNTCFARAHTSAIDSWGSELWCMGAENMDHGPLFGGLDASKIKLLDSTTPCMSLSPIFSNISSSAYLLRPLKHQHQGQSGHYGVDLRTSG